ncbi:unnamed protein product [Acanthoscelides obtectus]|uniref:Uncharacterized protein n=1 Tax=Acanthoscelides obtectus TaxID=200917 RepID=A0A9P0KUV5_ACAOB|nr:unnamed protein product [Acanthoscelides obtectus]CAK1631897.1 hypothetical protein AOBTE_LOCUS7230 [Acanthoscelides obtectus]
MQTNRKFPSKCTSSQGNGSRKEISGSCTSKSVNKFPSRQINHVKMLLKDASGCHMCEMCGQIAGNAVVEIERERKAASSKCVSKKLYILCDMCLASILGRKPGKADAGKETSCDYNTSEFANHKKMVKEVEPYTCHAPYCNHNKSNTQKPEEPYETACVKCQQKSNTVSKKSHCGKKGRAPCGGHKSKSNEKNVTKTSETKCQAACAGTAGDKEDIKHAIFLEVTDNHTVKSNQNFKQTTLINRQESTLTPSEKSAEKSGTITTSSYGTIKTIDLEDNFEISSNKTEYGVLTDYVSEYKKASAISVFERQRTMEENNFEHEEKNTKSCRSSVPRREIAVSSTNTDQGRVNCGPCGICDSSVSEKILTSRSNCVNCLYMNNNNNKVARYGLATAQIKDKNDTSMNELQYKIQSSVKLDKIKCKTYWDKNKETNLKEDLMMFASCEPCNASAEKTSEAKGALSIDSSELDQIKCETCLDKDEETKLEEDLMTCASCEPCHASVQEIIATKDALSVKCSELDKIKCDTFFDKDKETNLKEDLRLLVSCGPCNGSAQETFAAKGAHSVDCSEHDKIKCETCLNKGEETKLEEDLMTSASCEPCHASARETFAAKGLFCVEFSENDKIECEGCLHKMEESKRKEDLMICKGCEPCYPSLEESIVAKQLHCVECSEEEKTVCETCLDKNKQETKPSQAVMMCATAMEHHYVECAKLAQTQCENCLIKSNRVKQASNPSSATIRAACESCHASLKDMIAALEQHCIECAEPTKTECENCLRNVESKTFSGSQTTSQKSKIPLKEEDCKCERCKGIDTTDLVNGTDKVVCGGCFSRTIEDINRSQTTLKVLNCKDGCTCCVYQDDMFTCDAFNEERQYKTIKAPVATQVSINECACEGERLTSAVCYDQIHSLPICAPCDKESIITVELHCVKFSNPGKIDCESCLRKSELPSTKRRFVEEICQSQCCECDNKHKIMQISSICVYYQQTIAENKSANEIRYVECSNANEILCESYLSIASKHDNKAIGGKIDETTKCDQCIGKRCAPVDCRSCKNDGKESKIDIESDKIIKCDKCMGEKCAPNRCQNCEDIGTNVKHGCIGKICALTDCRNCSDTKSKVSELQVEVCEQYKDDFHPSEEVHCLPCKHIAKIQCERCLEIVSCEKNNTRMVYELDCETCKHLSFDNNCITDKNNVTSSCSICCDKSTYKNLVKGHNSFKENEGRIECTNDKEIQCEIYSKRNFQTENLCIRISCEGVCAQTAEKLKSKSVSKNCRTILNNPSNMIVKCSIYDDCNRRNFGDCKPNQETIDECLSQSQSTNIKSVLANSGKNLNTTMTANSSYCTDTNCPNLEKMTLGSSVFNKSSSKKKSQISKVQNIQNEEKMKSKSDFKSCCTILSKSSIKNTKSSNAKYSICENCGGYKSNKITIHEYFGHPQSSKSKTLSTIFNAYEKDKNTAKPSAESLISCNVKDCPILGQGTSQSSDVDDASFKKDSHDNEYCETCQKQSYAKQNRQQEEQYLECIYSDNILCESCLRLEQSITLARNKVKSSQTSQGDDNCSGCKHSNEEHEQNSNNVKAKNIIPIFKQSTNEEVTCTCGGYDLVSSKHKIEEDLFSCCSECAGRERHMMEEKQVTSKSCCSSCVPTVLQEKSSTKSQRINSAEIQTELYEVISVSISESVSDTSTKECTSHTFEKPPLSMNTCSTNDFVYSEGMMPLDKCHRSVDVNQSQSKPKYTCHLGTNTSTPISNYRSITIKTDEQEISTREVPKCHCPSVEQKVGNSLKGECGSALKYKLSRNDKRSDYVLLTGPFYIKKSCVGAKDKVSKATSGTPASDVGDTIASASRLQSERFRKCRECCRSHGCAMPELKQLCVLEPDIIIQYQQQYLSDKVPRRLEEDDFDPKAEYVPYLVKSHGYPPSNDKYHFLMLDMECLAQSKEIMGQDIGKIKEKTQGGSELKTDLQLLEQQMSASSEERPHSILITEFLRTG